MQSSTKRLEHLFEWVASEWDEIPNHKKTNTFWRMEEINGQETHKVTSETLCDLTNNSVGNLFGWYVTSPQVLKQGLFYNDVTGALVYKDRENNLLIGSDAVKAYFGINSDEYAEIVRVKSIPFNSVPTKWEYMAHIAKVIASMQKRTRISMTDVKIGSDVRLRNGVIKKVMQLIHAPEALNGEHDYIIQFGDKVVRTYTFDGFVKSEEQLNGLDIVEVLN